MKSKLLTPKKILFLFVLILFTFTSKYLAQAASCPFAITNLHPCDVYINWEVRIPNCTSPNCTSPPCPAPQACCDMPCNGSTCISANGGVFNIPANCCNGIDDVVVYVSGFDSGANNCNGSATCGVYVASGAYTCAGAISCNTGVNPVNGSLTGASCGCSQTTYTVTWTSTGITIN